MGFQSQNLTLVVQNFPMMLPSEQFLAVDLLLQSHTRQRAVSITDIKGQNCKFIQIFKWSSVILDPIHCAVSHYITYVSFPARATAAL